MDKYLQGSDLKELQGNIVFKYLLIALMIDKDYQERILKAYMNFIKSLVLIIS